MGILFGKNKTKKRNTLNIDGYIIDKETGMLMDVPKGLKIYNVPREVKVLEPELNLSENKALQNFILADEVNFKNSSITEIPAQYFTFCAKYKFRLKKITLPECIKKLGHNCIDMTTVQCDFPTSLEYLGKNMYPDVQKLVLGENIKTLEVLFASHDTKLIEVEVAGSVKELPKHFINQCKNVEKVILHEGVENAGCGAFRGLNNLVYVELPESFKNPFVSEMEFRHINSGLSRGNGYDAKNIESEKNNVLTIKKVYNGIPYVFQVRRGDFAQISFENGIATITASNKSTGKQREIKIDLGDLNNALICQVDLQNLEIRQVLPEVSRPPQSPFPRPTSYSDDTEKIKNLNIDGYIIDKETGMLIDVPKGLKIYNVPREVRVLDPELSLSDNEVLQNFRLAEEVNFKNSSITEIPSLYFTFGDKSGIKLKKITLPECIKKLGNNCIDMTTVECNFPTSLEYLGKNMYPDVQELVLGENIKLLDNSFASSDPKLIDVEVAGSIKHLPNNFINQCKNIKKVILHEGIQSAGNAAFRGLNNLIYLELPESFNVPFVSEMENRHESGIRGNSSFNTTNFESEKNNVLTIKKVYNGIPYIFQLRRGDFAQISFENGIATITASNKSAGKQREIKIDLEKLNNNYICHIDLQNSEVMQVQPVVSRPPQSPFPRPTSFSDDNDDQVPNFRKR